jgi:hypothetical protein
MQMERMVNAGVEVVDLVGQLGWIVDIVPDPGPGCTMGG